MELLTFDETQRFITTFTRAHNMPYPQPDESSPCFPIIFAYGLTTNVQSFQNK